MLKIVYDAHITVKQEPYKNVDTSSELKISVGEADEEKSRVEKRGGERERERERELSLIHI